MIIKELRALRGPNFFHVKPVIFMKLDIGDLEKKPSNVVPNLLQNLTEVMPTLVEHGCSIGVRGGFLKRIKEGTWAGHIAEHIALELQNLIGDDVTYGKTVTLKEKGFYDIIFRYKTEGVGLRSAEMAVEIADNLFQGRTVAIEPYLKELQNISDNSKLGPSTSAIVREAQKRDIPYIRLNNKNYIQLGLGKYQRRIEATLMDSTSALGVEIAANKKCTKHVLSKAGIPVPRGGEAESFEEAKKIAEGIGYPVVVKPASGNHGRGVTTDINGSNGLKSAFQKAMDISDSGEVIIEEYLGGSDFRLLVIGGKLVAAAQREPACVIGDGSRTIRELIEIENNNPERGEGHDKNLTRIAIDEDTQQILKKQGYQLDDVPTKDEKVYLKYTANISSGGTATDVTDRVHPINRAIAERISRIVGLDVMGIDLIAKNIEKPIRYGEAGVVEVNAGPGFRMHLSPSRGKPRNVAKAVVDMLFPEGQNYHLPICAVTGTNGKTTTTRLISHILNLSNYVVGMTSTDGVVIDNVPVLKGDYSGPCGAREVIKDSTVERVVLEVARGGILRRGLGFQKCDVGVLLNISPDHLGMGGIETLDDLTRLKATVTEAVKKDGFAIFNADDAYVMSRAHQTKGRTVFFSMHENSPILIDNLKKENFNVTVSDDTIVIQKPSGNFDIAHISNVPLTFEGRAKFNIENVLAAVAACYCLGVSERQINAGLISCSSSIGQIPGRMNVIDFREFKVVVDYGHNVGAIEATGDFLMNLMPGRKIRMVSGVGDRRDEDIIEYGKAVAKYSDYIVISDPANRNRKLGETANLVKQGILMNNFPANKIAVILNENDATDYLLKMAKPRDLIILQADNVSQIIQKVLTYRKDFFTTQGVNIDKVILNGMLI